MYWQLLSIFGPKVATVGAQLCIVIVAFFIYKFLQCNDPEILNCNS